MEKLLLIDGNSLFNRAYYATPLSFSMKDGTPTNAVYGFTTMLFKAILDFAPTHIAVGFDLHHPTFRHELYKDYKGTRKPMQDDLRVQVPLIKDMLKAMKISICEKEGYEADDILGTLSCKCPFETIILTGDNDYLQLISDKTTVYITKKGLSDLKKMDLTALKEEKNLVPSQIIELKSLMGDSSDNIPGVLGIGEKTAENLLNNYHDLDGVYAHLDEIKGALKNKLIFGKESAYLSKTLATIDVDAKFDFNFDDMRLIYPFDQATRELFEKYEFKSLLKRTEFFGESESEHHFDNTPITSRSISTLLELEQIINENKNATDFAFDGNCSFAFEKSTSYTVEIAKDLFGGINYQDFIAAIKPLLEGKINKTLFDKKATRHALKQFDVEVNNCLYDLSLLQYVADFKSNVSTLSALLKAYDFNEQFAPSFMLLLKEDLLKELDENGLTSLYFDVELPLSDVLFDMEKEGFLVDKSILKELEEQYLAEISTLTEKIYEAAGERFNVNSPKQLGEIIYVKLNLGKGKKTSTGYSTSADELEKLADKHPLIPLVLRYRQISKLLSTYVLGLTEQIESDGKIHTVFNQALTTTGRLSSKEPNLQNIPVRTQEGRVLRKLFIPSNSDNVLISADYSQIELRLLAHFSSDPELTKAYNLGEDIHTRTAASVFDVPISEVSSEMRSKSKAVNFGIIYGISDFGLAKQIHVPTKVASNYIKKYFESYPNVKAYMDSNVAFCKEHGYVSTITGRRRKIREINSTNFVQRSFGERAAMNMPLQGSAADIIKIAMIKVFDELKNRNLKSKIILQIHDELIIDCKKNELEEVLSILKEQMENAVSLSIPLEVNISYGDSWYDAK